MKSVAKQAGTSQQYVRNVKATILKEGDDRDAVAPASTQTAKNARRDAQDALTDPNRATAPSAPEAVVQTRQDASQGAGVQPAREPIPAGSPIPDPVAAQIPNGRHPNRGPVDPFAPFPVAQATQDQSETSDQMHEKIPEPAHG